MRAENDDSPQAMDGLIDEVEALHSSPVVAHKVLSLLKDPEFHVRDVEKQLAADPALAAAVLRLVNSSGYGLRRRISSLREAVTYLGLRSLRLMLLSFGLIDRLTRGTPAMVCRDFWRRALTTAVAASRLCTARDVVPPDDAYSAGLLADLGALVFAQADTDRYVSLCIEHGHGRELVAAERREFGFDHPALGGRLLSRWNLPQPLTRAVARHHDDRASRDLLDRAVVAGGMLAAVLWAPQSPQLPQAQRFLGSEFGLDLDGLISFALECKADVLDHADLFCVDLADSIDSDELLKRALRRYKTEALETAMDWDSLTTITDHDFGPAPGVSGPTHH